MILYNLAIKLHLHYAIHSCETVSRNVNEALEVVSEVNISYS